MHLRCPHCQNPIEIADMPSGGEISCAGCGSSFQLAGLSTAIWDGPTNKHIGKFEVLGTVGHGAFGTVLKAHDTELDRIVAIKVPRASNIGPEPQDLDRFLREARSVAQLRFPSIITIHEVGIDNGMPYLVSDFVEGITLADHLTGRGFTFTKSAKLLAEIAEALQYAHSLGVVHRDVKPSNIMIRPDGSPCLMDFGLAKRDAGEITMTIDGQILGTPAYMSPEQARGEGHGVDGRSDVYSLGVILYQLLTGELPFRGNKAMLLHQVLHDEPRGPRTLNDKIPRDLETIALKAMAKEPGRRYGSAKEMAEDLRRWLAGESILARPVGMMERSWRWCKRTPAPATLAFSTILAGLALAAVSWIAFVNSKELVWQLAQQRHAKAVEVQLEALSSSIMEAELAHRASIQTGDKKYLTRCKTAIAKVLASEKKLAWLQQYPGLDRTLLQNMHLHSMHEKLMAATNNMTGEIEFRNRALDHADANAAEIVRLEMNYALLDEIRQNLTEMASEESRRTVASEAEVEATSRANFYLLGIGSILAVLLILAGGLLVMRV